MEEYSLEQIREIYRLPLLDLVYKAATIHRQYHDPRQVQVSTLISIKTGGCPEDCAYCAQSARYATNIEKNELLPLETVIEAAKAAKEQGASRLCMGAAWRNVRNNDDFDRVLEMVKEVNALGMEVCCTLGMLTEHQARRLADAGLYAYNHNLDTSEEYYGKIISTRTYEDRLKTLNNVAKAGIHICSGGIIGMGEAEEDRLNMLLHLTRLRPHPHSVPINALVPIKGTPLEKQQPVLVWDIVRMIATTRIVLPRSQVRLSAGRVNMSREAQALCFLAGANSIFAGDKLLTTGNPSFEEDKEMFTILGLVPQPPYKHGSQPQTKETYKVKIEEIVKWSRPQKTSQS